MGLFKGSAGQTPDTNLTGFSDRLAPADAFPYDNYRTHQKDALQDASAVLWVDDLETVVLNLPTGIGKSGINTALCRQATDAFLTTPQKALRTQLEQDRDLKEYYSVLRARDDYLCTVGNIEFGRDDFTCLTCPINQDDEDSCLHREGCPYWSAKESAMADPIAVITFSYLVVDNFLPEVVSISSDEHATASLSDAGTTQRRVSFGDRELLVVDECHKLEDQVASLHAGFAVSPYSLPPEVFGNVDSEVGELPEDMPTKFEDVREDLIGVYDRAESYIQAHGRQAGDDPQPVVNCRSFVAKFDYCAGQVEAGRDWVVHRKSIHWDGSERYSIRIQPVDVDEFLKEFVWSRADKYVLSTATMPFSETPGQWLERLGLNPENAQVIQYPMPFPVENRQVFTSTAVGKMSSGGYEKYRNDIISKLSELSRRHEGEKGLIHTASYDRARELAEAFPENAIRHSRNAEFGLSGVIDEWQSSEKDMLFSPSATDGVDLPGDMCRWQALVKVPYPQPSNPRVRFLLDERGDWNWYYEVTCQEIQQSVGRGVRSKEDFCSYYVLDYSFMDVVREASVPDWFRNAVVL